MKIISLYPLPLSIVSPGLPILSHTQLHAHTVNRWVKAERENTHPPDVHLNYHQSLTSQY